MIEWGNYISCRDTRVAVQHLLLVSYTAVMPLNTAVTPFQLSSYEDIKENFIIFYSSRDESGNLWCPVSALLTQTDTPVVHAQNSRSKNALVFSNSIIRIHLLRSPYMPVRRYRCHQDCRDVEDFVRYTFAPADGPSGLIIYVGQRSECVTPLSGHSPRSRPVRREKRQCFIPLVFYNPAFVF
jgi:hypothetical protein